MEPKVSLPCSQEPSTGPYSEPDESGPHPHIAQPGLYSRSSRFIATVRTSPSYKPHVNFQLFRSCYRSRLSPRPLLTTFSILDFYGEKWLATRSTPKLEDYPYSAARDWLFRISENHVLLFNPSGRSLKSLICHTHPTVYFCKLHFNIIHPPAYCLYTTDLLFWKYSLA
jgi:hypothetical protein